MKYKAIATLFILWAIAALVIAEFMPENHRTVGEEFQNPGKRTYVFDVVDVNGNYHGNFLRMRLLGSAEDLHGLKIGGCHIWEKDPNFLTIDNAVADTNDPNNNIYGSFTITKVWKHHRYAIGILLFDVADNNDVAVGYINSIDSGKPKTKNFSIQQK